MFNATTTTKAASLRCSVAAFALLFTCTIPTWAQAGTLGAIAGRIADAKTGDPIPGALLQISSPSQAIAATTDAHGHFVAFSLQPDTYTITVEKRGYDTSSISGFTVSADQTQQYDLSLTPSANAPPKSH
jgi:hypothetical protein